MQEIIPGMGPFFLNLGQYSKSERLEFSYSFQKSKRCPITLVYLNPAPLLRYQVRGALCCRGQRFHRAHISNTKVLSRPGDVAGSHFHQRLLHFHYMNFYISVFGEKHQCQSQQGDVLPSGHESGLVPQNVTTEFSDHVLDKRIYLLNPKKQNSEKHLPPPLQEQINIFSRPLPLPTVGPLTCTSSQNRMTSRNSPKGTWHCHAFCYTSLAGKWSLFHSFLFSIEIY